MKEIKSRTNDYIKKLKSLERKKYRDEYGLFMIEGAKAIGEALRWDQEFECLIVAEADSEWVQAAEQRDIPVLKVGQDILCLLADAVTPQGELAVLRKRPMTVDMGKKFYVALDGIADPKNVGTIIRTADAMGADGIFISPRSADFYGPKVQRAAMGSTFHIPIEVCDITEKLYALGGEGVEVIAGYLGGEDELSDAIGRACVVIGNEARGIAKETAALADTLFEIPIYGAAESLNAGVAAGIMLYEVRKRLKG